MNIIKGIKKRFFEGKRVVRLKNAEELLKHLDWERLGLAEIKTLVLQKKVDAALGELQTYYAQRNDVHFLLNYQQKSEQIALLRKKFPEEEKQVLAAADAICRHEISIFPNVKIEFGERMNWHTSFQSEVSWPQLPAHKIDCRSPRRLGDVKLTWELNRHQYLHIPGKAFWYSGDEKYLTETFAQIIDWIEQNPVGIGINWESTLEVAIRLISWCWVLFYFQPELASLKNNFPLILKSIFEHAEFIFHNLTDWGNNHVIGESAGLFIASLLFPEFKSAKKWLERSQAVLEKEILNQVYADGLSREKSICYHRFVLDFYLLAALTARLNNIKFSEPVLSRIRKMVDVLSLLMRPDGRWPRFGDDDSSQGLVYDFSPESACHLTLAAGYWLDHFETPENPLIKSNPNFIWLLCENFHSFQKQKVYAIHAENSVAGTTELESGLTLEASRIFIYRNDWSSQANYLYFDAGEMGLEPSFSHAHSDRLHFELAINGEPLFVDSGTFTYNGEPEWRNYFRRAALHNSVSIGEQDQATMVGTFRWANPPKTESVFCLKNENFWVLSGAYCLDMENIDNQPAHRRIIIHEKPEDWYIIDFVENCKNQSVDWYFQLSPENKIEQLTDDSASIHTPAQKLGFSFINSDKILPNQSEGWYSPAYHEKIPRPVLHLNSPASNVDFKINLFHIAGHQPETGAQNLEMIFPVNENHEKIEPNRDAFGIRAKIGAKFVTFVLNRNDDVLEFERIKLQSSLHFSIGQGGLLKTFTGEFTDAKCHCNKK